MEKALDLIPELEERDAIMHDQHLVLKSGRHGSDYINMDFAFSDAQFMGALGLAQAKSLVRIGLDALVAPAIGGVSLVQWVALGVYKLEGRWLKIYWAEKQPNGGFAFERARWQHDLKGLRVAGVEDVVTTGGSLLETLTLAEKAGSELVTSSATVKRGDQITELAGCSFSALAHVDYPDWDASKCPQCDAGAPIAIDVAHGAKFREEHPDYPGGWVELLGA
jgi:orotate phosphoribosyltransferase